LQICRKRMAGAWGLVIIAGAPGLADSILVQRKDVMSLSRFFVPNAGGSPDSSLDARLLRGFPGISRQG